MPEIPVPPSDIDYGRLPSPAYVLDVARLRKNLEFMHQVQQESGVSIILALKGFALWKTFPLVSQYLSGATASSLHEARLIFEEMGVKAHTYSPAYIADEFDEIARLSSHITFNSLNEYDRFFDRLPTDVSVGLRVNPEYSDVDTDLYNPASPVSRLGMTAPQLPERLPDGIEGLHVHTLCESSAAASAELIETVEAKFGHLFPKLKWVNFGGGHLMTRSGYDRKTLIEAIRRFRNKHPHLQVWMEPGSAVVWETGELVSTVLDIVENGGLRTAILNVSFTAHMPDTLEMPYRPQIIGAYRQPPKGKPAYRLGGVSCLAGDFMAPYAFERELQIGDRLVFLDMIHYTMVKTTTFNGVRHPDIGWWTEDDRWELLRRFTYEDYKDRLA